MRTVSEVTSQVILSRVRDYIRERRESLLANGTCDPGGGPCKQGNLELDCRGSLVCYRTREPCPADQVKLIHTLWQDCGL